MMIFSRMNVCCMLAGEANRKALRCLSRRYQMAGGYEG